MFDGMPRAKVRIADKGYDSDDFREALEECGLTPFIPPRQNRKVLIAYDQARYKTRHKIDHLREIQRLESFNDKARSLFCHLLIGYLYSR